MLSREEVNLLEIIREDYSMLNYHVLESMADWVKVVDYDCRIIYANSSMKKALGHDIMGKKCEGAHGNTEPCSFCISKRSIERKETIQKEEVINGRFFSVKSSPVMNAEGKAIGAVEVFRDVTRERKLELEIIEQNKKMSKDLMFAKRLQSGILPQKGRYGSVDIDYLYRPSEMLSGDIFDIYYIDEENLGIYICDVVGNGVTASMMTMFVIHTMRNIKDNNLSPSLVLEDLHRQFTKLNLNADQYFTIFYGVYNIKNKSFKYTNAGHNCIPIKYNQNEIQELKTNGFPISLIFNKINYDENEIQLESGDEILFYTDGITEAKNIECVEFGIERVIEIVEKDRDNILDTLANSVDKFRWKDQQDDLAMVLMKVLD